MTAATIDISITRALTLQKTLTARIAKASADILITVPTKGTGDMKSVLDTPQSLAEVEADLRANYQQLNDLVERRNEIRRKILISNATTIVVIGEKEYTVVEAIDARKNIAEKETLLRRLKQNRSAVTTTFNKMAVQFDTTVEAAKQSVIASGKNTNEAVITMVTAPIIASSTPGVLDPLDIAKLIERLEIEISDFKDNVDYVLSESNAATKITIAA